MHTSGNLSAIEPDDLFVISPEAQKLTIIRLPDPITNCYFEYNEKDLHVTAFTYEARFKLKQHQVWKNFR